MRNEMNVPQRASVARSRLRRGVSTITVSTILMLGTIASAAGASIPPQPIPPNATDCPASSIVLAAGVVLSCSMTGDAGSEVVTHHATVDLTQGGVVPTTVLSNDTVFQAGLNGVTPNEPVSSMVDRTGAVLGINGGFFDNDKGPGHKKGEPTEPGAPPEVFSGQICGGLVTNGRIVKSPPSDPKLNMALAVHEDGHMSIGSVTFDGTLTANGTSFPLDGINSLAAAAAQPSCPKALARGPVDNSGITLITPDMGAVILQDTRYDDDNSNYIIENGVYVAAHRDLFVGSDDYVVDTVTTGQITEIPQLLDGQIALVASSPEPAVTPSPASWVLDQLTPGTPFTASGALSDPTITSLIGAPAALILGGSVTDLGDYYTPPSDSMNAETLLGLDATGTQVTIMVIDAYEGWSTGVTPSQAQALMADAGVESAVLFDGGGSSTLAARLPTPVDAANPCGPGAVVVSIQSGANDYPPGCDNQRYVGDALTFTPKSPTPAPAATPTLSPSSPAEPVLAPTGAAPPLVGTLIAAALIFAGIFTLLAGRRGRRTLPKR